MDAQKPSKGVLEQSVFGRGKATLWWVEARYLHGVSIHVRDSVGVDILEMVSTMKFEGTYILTYLFGRESGADRLVIKVTMPEKNTLQTVSSIAEVWPSAIRWEREISERFPFRFGTEEKTKMEGSA